MIILRADGGLDEPLTPIARQQPGRRLRKFWAATVVLVLCLSSTVTTNAQPNDTPDYAQPEHWLALPFSADKTVDVFYLYPTAYQKGDASAPNISSIDYVPRPR